MNQFKRKMQNDIVNPVGHSHRAFKGIARVTKSEPDKNTCSIEFINKDGYKSNKNNVQVKIYTRGFIGWFPEFNDYVTIESSGNHFEITSMANTGYSGNVKSKIELKSDIMSGSLVESTSGFIL